VLSGGDAPRRALPNEHRMTTTCGFARRWPAAGGSARRHLRHTAGAVCDIRPPREPL
jgi:hypothetical protein